MALDRLQDPGNLGTLFRTALAADVEVLWLALDADPLSQKGLRASSGAVLHLPYQRIGSTEKEAIEKAHNSEGSMGEYDENNIFVEEVPNKKEDS